MHCQVPRRRLDCTPTTTTMCLMCFLDSEHLHRCHNVVHSSLEVWGCG